MQFKLLGAVQHPVIVGEYPQPGRVNYFIGKDPSKWHRNVPTFAQVRYKNVYPGVDLVYYGNHRQLEYDFAISPGADPNLIHIEIQGASQIRTNPEGDLVLDTASGTLRFQTPHIYQESGGVRVPVLGSYVLSNGSSVAFQVARYDSSEPLVIDPVMVYSTYLGGSGNDQPVGIAVDKTGSVYIAGSSDSTNFPLATLGSLPTGTEHVFVAKLDPSGSNLVYADYIGGNSQDSGYALALNSNNEVYITGSTASSDFPAVNAYQGSYPGSFNAFLTKISSDGSSLLYSTYLGGNGSDIPASIAIDSRGSAIVAGNTTSTTFPTAKAYQASVSANQGGLYGNYGFLTKFSPDGSSLVYSTYLGGSSNVPYNCGGTPCWGSPYSAVSGLALDSNGAAYTAGITNTYDFPATPGAYLPSDSAQDNGFVGFVSKFDSSGNLAFSTYFYESSGAVTDLRAIAVDGSGSAYIAGAALSDGSFPITSTSICDPSVFGFGCGSAFVTKFDSNGASLLYSTFLGPNNGANPQSLVLDSNDDAYVLSSTASGSFATINGIEPYTGQNDLLLVEIDPLATSQLFATYLGASGNESPAGIALDSNGNFYVAGVTDSADFPIMPGDFQTVPGGSRDGFVVKIGPAFAPAVTLAPGLLQFPLQPVGTTSQPQNVLLRNMGSTSLSISSITTTGDFLGTDDCSRGLPATGICTLSVVFTPIAPGVRSGSLVIQDDAAGSPHKISLSGTGLGQGASLAPAGLSFASQPVGSPSAAQTATLTNSGNAPLTLNGVQVTGDYAQSNNCPASLAAGAACAISVAFTPTIISARAGTLTVTDNASSSPQSVSLSGIGSDFSIGSSPSASTVKAGESAIYNLTVSPLGGNFPVAVRLSCSGLPSKSSCAFSPGTLTPGAAPVPSILSIITTGAASGGVANSSWNVAPPFLSWIQLPGLALLGMLIAGPKRSIKKNVFITGVIALVTIFMVGCGGTGIVTVPPSGTPPGTYTVTLTGTSGGLQHSVPVTLTVK